MIDRQKRREDLEEGEEGPKGGKNGDGDDGLGTLYDPEDRATSDEKQHQEDDEPAHPERQRVFLLLIMQMWFHVIISIASSTFWHPQKL